MMKDLKLSDINVSLVQVVCKLMGYNLPENINLLMDLRDELIKLNPDLTIGELMNDDILKIASSHFVGAHDAVPQKPLGINDYKESLCKCPNCEYVAALHEFAPKLFG